MPRLRPLRAVAASRPRTESRPRPRGRDQSPGSILITGGAGFIGCNLADALLRRGEQVIILDNLARDGVEVNAQWLRQAHGERVRIQIADIRDQASVRQALRGVTAVYHFAAQVAVTTSLVAPMDDFSVNAQGTLTLLEELRRLPTPPPLLYTSTNKVYGALEDVSLRRSGARYQPVEATLRARGVAEDRPLDLYSPYGCSKGAADQYVLDYARTFHLPTVVFRMSCIYGPHQCGTEDQGWIAHFIRQALAGRPITLYGDGLQVRDALHVSDLVDALCRARERIADTRGRAFNIGGGPERAGSLHEVLSIIRSVTGARVRTRLQPWRPGDQRWYVSDTRAFSRATGWIPHMPLAAGIAQLCHWFEQAGDPTSPQAVEA